MASRARHRRGANLAEILVAFAVFVSAFLALLGVFPAALRAVQQARELTAATFLAEQAIENEKAKPFEAIASSSFVASVEATSNGSQSRVDYAVVMSVTPTPPSAPTRKQLTVLVSWSTPNLRSTQISTEVLAPQ
jgi:Tfp pilus assembly protein PilV